jgi:hypothetical protein
MHGLSEEAVPLPDDPVERFIERWAASGADERANFQPFFIGLFDLLGVPHQETGKPDPTLSSYAFEYPVVFPNPDGTKSTGRIDLYRRGCFVLEAKQGADQQLEEQLALFGGRQTHARKGTAVRGTPHWTAAMQQARGQAERYAKALPVDHGWPPFLVVVDVGHCFELYADFSGTGKNYAQFPDAHGFRIPLAGLRDPAIRARLATIWTEPKSLDPTARAAQVTKTVSERLARVARALEKAGHAPERVAGFLMRCIFSMFAEDVGLLPAGCFSKLLRGMRARDPAQLVHALAQLWAEMDTGTVFSAQADDRILRFNGGLFADRTAIPLAPEQLGLLIDAAEDDWRDVEPAIFGTFLEQALDPQVRQKLGAEFTPRRWVERLVLPAIVEPLRERWDNVKATALAHGMAGDRDGAIASVKTFHHYLCNLRVLDPACGTGNFLYVKMEHLKRLEGEVLDLLQHELGVADPTLELAGLTVDPHQFLGLELNPRAVQIAEVVLWIGYLQWHFKTKGRVLPAQPVLKNFANIKEQDAILAYDAEELVRAPDGRPETRWDGRSTKTDLVTGREVPDDSKRAELCRYVNPRPAAWPEADFIVGNPPFTGGKDLRDRLGGYAEALWQAYPDMPRAADLVMYWWRRAADLVRTGKVERFGLITTNSLTQTFNRRVVAAALEAKPPLGLAFAVPDHPWYLDGGMAAVRIAMTVGVAGAVEGRLVRVVDPQRNAARGGDALRPAETGRILPNLTLGVDLGVAKPLRANEDLCSRGMSLHGAGFIVTPERARRLGLGSVPGLERHIRPYRNGKDLTRRPRGVLVIDLFGLDETEVRTSFPAVFQHVLETVKPERASKVGRSSDMSEYAKKWWLFGKPRTELRPALDGLKRYVATVETAKHRVFQFLAAEIIPDNMLVNIATDDAFVLGVLSSRIHVCWALAAGARLGYGNDPRYSKTRCFDPFPFPVADEARRSRIAAFAEELDAHRKRVLAKHPDLTLTGLYNVLDALRAGRALTPAEQEAHERGLIAVLRHLHDQIDEAVFDAYGWPRDLDEQAILGRLVELNRARRAEEADGLVRWLRPDYQAPAGTRIDVDRQGDLAIETIPAAAGARAGKPPWPRTVEERIVSVRALLAAQSATVPLDALATAFKRKPKEDLQDVLNALVALGLARRVEDGRYAP